MSSDQNEYRAQRLQHLDALRQLGYTPFGAAFARTGTLSAIRAGFQEDGAVSAAGRLLTIRDMGKSIFAHLYDGTDRFQIYVQKSAIGDAAFDAFKLLDLGDHVGVSGALFTTRMGEQTVKVGTWTLLSKALLPPPEKFHGLQDVEARYRQRYLDLLSNHEVRLLFDRRIRCVEAIRGFLRERGFAEVETPMIQAQAGGAAANPFVTRYEALAASMYLRIAPELYLKQLLVGGFDKVFELNRCFRNEGLSRTHNPEFTMLEIYEAYTDLRGMQRLIQDLITTVAQGVYGTLAVGEGERRIDLTLPWRERAYRDLIVERMGADWYSLPLGEAQRRGDAAGLHIDPAWDLLMVTHEVYEKLIEKTLIQPTFVTRLPAALIPLAKTCEDDPTCADVFELVIGGTEIAPAYSELNDPLEQRRRLMAQSGGDASKMDEAFLTALEHGMPPAGGMGVGIDRLVMILSGAESLRDVILFPQLRQKSE
ncbi:MAG: lysine--tRNA ligase [Lentisphaerae bacterium]|nr:lysine--tRNA ligase [Lentisphaerota bacterium]